MHRLGSFELGYRETFEHALLPYCPVPRQSQCLAHYSDCTMCVSSVCHAWEPLIPLSRAEGVGDSRLRRRSALVIKMCPTCRSYRWCASAPDSICLRLYRCVLCGVKAKAQCLIIIAHPHQEPEAVLPGIILSCLVQIPTFLGATHSSGDQKDK